jgi:hypothetical protein
VAQRAVEAQSVVQRDVEGMPVAQRPELTSAAASAGAAMPVAQRLVDRQAAVMHGTTHAGFDLQPSVDSGQLATPVAELLWPPRVDAGSGSVLPLASSEPLTVPEMQQPTNVASVTPAVQRVVFDHPGLRTPSSSRTIPVSPAQPSAVPAPVVEAEEQVLSWSAGESFHSEPAVQRAETVRSVSLQQMFSGVASTEGRSTEQFAVQRDEAPAVEPAAAQPAVQTAAAPAPAAPAPAKGVSAAEVEELAKRLYEPLTAKLKAELWLDRERAGRVTDRW